jgi:hypothetical protein
MAFKRAFNPGAMPVRCEIDMGLAHHRLSLTAQLQ